MSLWGEIDRLLGDRKKTRRKRKRTPPRKKNGEFRKSR